MGYINSIETMGLVDGPGIRFVVFMQGCHLRCLYCHNPETWPLNKGIETTPEALFERIKRYKNYFDDDGGVTFSGGEPLLQPEFLIETMKLCHEHGIHTAIDTAGVGTDLDEEILKYTDLVILDVKSSNPDRYRFITRYEIDKYNKFIQLCQKLNKKLWIRQVIVPGINDTKECMLELKEYLKNIKNIEKIELLPYHTYGENKYKKLKLLYPLKGFPPMDKEKIKELESILSS